MASYKIFFKKSVQKDLSSIPKNDSKKILSRIENLGEDPRPAEGEKLTGQERYRLRQGRYRILYSIQDEDPAVRIVKVGHRKDVDR